MARYTNLFTANDSIGSLRQALVETLKACDLNLIYETKDYLVAREKPGGVAFTKLATIEVLINPPRGTSHTAQVNLVVKNEELPLKRDNHCQRVFDLVNQAIADANGWQVA